MAGIALVSVRFHFFPSILRSLFHLILFISAIGMLAFARAIPSFGMGRLSEKHWKTGGNSQNPECYDPHPHREPANK